MPRTTDILAKMRILESFHVFYKFDPPPLDGLLRDKKEALKFFLSYAYGGRANAPKSYWIVAAHCLEEEFAGSRKPSAERTWARFCRLVPRPNPSRNPLNPAQGQKGPALGQFDFEAVVGLLREGRAEEAAGRLVTVRGVADKIAAYFLRDVADFCGFYDAGKWKLPDCCSVQPIDTWVRETAGFLGVPAGRHPPDRFREGDANCAWRICSICADNNINPLWFNEGAWLYASEVAGTTEHLKELLASTPGEMTAAATRVWFHRRDRFTEWLGVLRSQNLPAPGGSADR